jgi:hypothetical protein
MYTNEEVEKIVRDGERLVNVEDTIWEGHIDLDDIPEVDDDKWLPANVILKDSDGVFRGHVNVGRKNWVQRMAANENPETWNLWLSIFEPKIKEWMSQPFMKKLWGENWEIGDHGQIMKYEEGHYFGLHQDGGAVFTPRFRCALGLLFLSDDDEYEGGYYRAPAHDYCRKFKKGDWCIFPSTVYHELTPVIKGTRRAIFGEVYTMPDHWTNAHSGVWTDQMGYNVPKEDSCYQRINEIHEHYEQIKADVEKNEGVDEWLEDAWYPTPYVPKEGEKVAVT